MFYKFFEHRMKLLHYTSLHTATTAACSPGLRTSSASVLINTCWELERTVECQWSKFNLPSACEQNTNGNTNTHPLIQSLGGAVATLHPRWALVSERPTGVALTLSDPLASHLYDSHVLRRQAQWVMHNPLHHHHHTQGPSVQVRHPQVSPQVCCNVTLALSIRRDSCCLLLLFSPSPFLTVVQPGFKFNSTFILTLWNF